MGTDPQILMAFVLFEAEPQVAQAVFQLTVAEADLQFLTLPSIRPPHLVESRIPVCPL